MAKVSSVISTLVAAIIICTLTSCGGYNNKRAQEIVDKYHETGRLNHEEYGEAIDMCEDAFNHAIKTFEGLVKKSGNMNTEEFETAAKESINDLEKKYEYAEDLNKIIESASKEQMGTANYERWREVCSKFDKENERLYNEAQKSMKK